MSIYVKFDYIFENYIYELPCILIFYIFALLQIVEQRSTSVGTERMSTKTPKQSLAEIPMRKLWHAPCHPNDYAYDHIVSYSIDRKFGVGCTVNSLYIDLGYTK